jgi:hypothetical protein
MRVSISLALYFLGCWKEIERRGIQAKLSLILLSWRSYPHILFKYFTRSLVSYRIGRDYAWPESRSIQKWFHFIVLYCAQFSILYVLRNSLHLLYWVNRKLLFLISAVLNFGFLFLFSPLFPLPFPILLFFLFFYRTPHGLTNFNLMMQFLINQLLNLQIILFAL